jgi:translation initiation factor IF-2
VAGAAVGDITRSDIERAATVGNALILGFNVGIGSYQYTHRRTQMNCAKLGAINR